MRSFCLTIAALLILTACAQHEATVVNIRPDASMGNKQGLKQFMGVSGDNSGAQGISMNKVIIPAGGAAAAHSHSGFESTVYLIKGRVKTYYGEDLKQSIISKAGDFIYIPANMPHYPVNLSKTEEAVAIVARTDPREQEHVILYKPANK